MVRLYFWPVHAAALFVFGRRRPTRFGGYVILDMDRLNIGT